MLHAIIVLSLLFGASPDKHLKDLPHRPGWSTRATRYADTPRDEGGTPACKNLLPPPIYQALHPFRVAHRRLPCGALLVIEADGKRTLGAVLDRGPWGATGTGGVIPVAVQLPHGYIYRGDLDISPMPAEALGLSLRVGRLRVRYWLLGVQPFLMRRRGSNS